MKPVTRIEMAQAVERAAEDASRMACAAALHLAVLPSKADIRLGGRDVVRDAECLLAAFIELSSLARVTESNDQQRRKIA